MRIIDYLCFQQNRFTRVTSKSPSLHSNERAIKIAMNVDASLFARLTPLVEISLPVADILAPIVEVLPAAEVEP